MDTLIDRYLATVSDLLPANLRKDTVTEIRTLIQDALDDRSKSEGREPDDQMMADVLKQFGPPEKIVAPYLPERYLIGPRMFPIFMLVLRIVLPIVAILSLIGYFTGHLLPSSFTWAALFTNIFTALGTVLSAVVVAFGNIVLIFAILQWTVPEFSLPVKEDKPWDPHSLKTISQPDRIKRGELITEIIFSLIGIIVLTFYIDRVGIYNYVNGQWVMTPFLTPAFNAYIPWFDLLWVLMIIQDALLLRKGAWSTGARLFSMLLSAFNIVLAFSLLTNFTSLYTLEPAFGASGLASTLEMLLNAVLTFVFVIVIIANAVKIIQHLVRMLFRRPVAVEI